MKITLTTREIEDIVKKHLNCKLGIAIKGMHINFNGDLDPFNPISVEIQDDE